MSVKVQYGEYILKFSVKTQDEKENKVETIWDESRINQIIQLIAPKTFKKGLILSIEISPIDFLPFISNSLDNTKSISEGIDNRIMIHSPGRINEYK